MPPWRGTRAVPDGLDDVAGSRFALGAHHRGALGDAPQRLAQVAAAADERNLEIVLLDMVLLVGRGQHLALVDEVHLQRFEDLRLRRSGRCAPSPLPE